MLPTAVDSYNINRREGKRKKGENEQTRARFNAVMIKLTAMAHTG